eukprot:7629097-Pyramimonas_sp.AAC.1
MMFVQPFLVQQELSRAHNRSSSFQFYWKTADGRLPHDRAVLAAAHGLASLLLLSPDEGRRSARAYR